MNRQIIVPVDGATNIKLEVLDYDSLVTEYSATTETPVTERDDYVYNETGREFDWFSQVIQSLPENLKQVAVMAPVARGASGGLIGRDSSLIEVPGERLTLSYTQRYPEKVEEAFKELAGDADLFFQETGSVRDLPGSLTLVKRFLFEEMIRPDLVEEAAGFAHYGVLMAAHFLGGDLMRAYRAAGNEHSYWMCHSGARNINSTPGTPSQLCSLIDAFGQLVPKAASVAYKGIALMPPHQVNGLGLMQEPLIIPGGHDTCLSHLPVLATFYQTFKKMAGQPVIQVEAGTWTMIAQLGGRASLPPRGFERDIVVQGTVDGAPVVTGRYGGGGDFAALSRMAEDNGVPMDCTWDPDVLQDMLSGHVFVLPNVNPSNHGTGPFPSVKGRIINEEGMFKDGRRAAVAANLCTACATASQVEVVAHDDAIPIVLTAGGSRDPYFGRLIAGLTGRDVYIMFDKNGQAVSETTTLGAAIMGKAAVLGMHPYEVDLSVLGIRYEKVESLGEPLNTALQDYYQRWQDEVHCAAGSA